VKQTLHSSVQFGPFHQHAQSDMSTFIHAPYITRSTNEKHVHVLHPSMLDYKQYS